MEIKIKELKEYFDKREDVVLAFLFGSFANKKQMKDSDIDIAVYFKHTRGIEWEKKKIYPMESEIWSDMVDILERDDVDVVILNRVNPTLAFNVLNAGIPLVIKDKTLYSDFYLLVSKEAQDFSGFMEDYLKIKLSAKSLTEEARDRLIQRFDYLITYWGEKDKFTKLDFKTYRDNSDQRRNIERWVENIANVTIDIAKIILATEKKQMPKSYKEALLDFGFFFGLNEQEAKEFSQIAELRNILAHEYLEILYDKIQSFLKTALLIYRRLINFSRDYLKKSK